MSSNRLIVLAVMLLVAWTAGGQVAPDYGRDFRFTLPLFTAGGAWNQTAANAQVLGSNGAQIAFTYRVLCGDSTDMTPPGYSPTNWPFPSINWYEWTVPIFRAGAVGTQDVQFCDYEGNTEWPAMVKWGNQAVFADGGPVTVPSCDGDVRSADPAGVQDSDGHMVLYDPATYMSYDFWQATPGTGTNPGCATSVGGTVGDKILRAGYADLFDIRQDGTNPDGISSARAVGVPLLAGAILPENVVAGLASGTFGHALAVAIPGPRNNGDQEPDYFYPAATTEQQFYNSNVNAIASGQRLRMKSTLYDDNDGSVVDENALAPITRMYIETMRQYGAYIADNAGGFIFYAEDHNTAVLDLTDQQVLDLTGRTTLPGTQTKWWAVMDTLATELEEIPFAYGVCDGASSTITDGKANWEVVDNATQAGGTIFSDGFESGDMTLWSASVP